MNHRRQLILAAGLSPLVTPYAGLAQPAPRVRRIGTLSLSKRDNEVEQIGRTMLFESLRRAGWEEGRNLVIEQRFAEGEVARLDALAAELVRLEVELIVAVLNTAIAAAKRATSTVPIVMLAAVNPVELGFVQSLARPGGNVTGTLVQVPELVAKSLEILKELAPGRTRVAILGNPATPGTKIVLTETQRAASVLGMTIQFFEVTQPDDVMSALERIAASRAEVLLVRNDGVTESRLRDIMRFAIDHRVVAIGAVTLSTSVGGAMYYGSNLEGICDRSASYVDRILRGAKPAELPVEQPTRFDLILNLKTLRAIGITVPPIVLMRATEVIE